MTAKRITAETPEDTRARLYARVTKTDGCWLWTGPVDDDGYGQFHLSRNPTIGSATRRRAHRVAYELDHGPLPSDTVLRHRCDNPACVRPEHLVPGSQAENIADRDAREHTARGERNGNVKLTSSQVAAIRERRAGGVMLRVIAEEFAVSTTHVKNIVHGRTRAQDGV